MVWFYELHYREKKSQMSWCIQKLVVHRSFKLWVFWNLWPEISCRVALSKVFLEPVSFISTADKFVTNRWRTGQPSLTTLTMNGFTRMAKHGFDSWKWSNLAWSSSGSAVTIYFCSFPLCGPANASSRKAFVLILACISQILLFFLSMLCSVEI